MVKENAMQQTEIGLIPEDWEVINWNEFFDFKSTSSYSRSEIDEIGEYGYLHYGDIHTKIGSLLNPNEFISGYIHKSQIKNYTLIKKGDLIIADASEDYSGVGKGFEVIDEPIIPTISGLHTFLVREKKEGTFAAKFKGYFHCNSLIKKQYDNLATGLKVYSLSKGSFKNIQIPLPPLPEQQAIAEALSDTDVWIESLEDLITKKRLIKQGALQELLTPKEGWEVKKLGEIADYRRGSFPQPYGLDKWYDDINGMPFIQVFDVAKNRKLKMNTKRKISEAAQYMSVFVPKNTIVLTIQGSIGRIAMTQYDAYCDRTLLIFERINLDIDKFFFLLSVEQIFEIEKEKAPGGTIKTITKEALSDFNFVYPQSLTEQNKIATILSDMDTEIEQLEQKLTKARQIKQGMMQELLTGRVRLV